MAKWVIKFTGYMNPKTKPRKLPATVQDYIVVEVQTNDDLVAELHKFAGLIIRAGGMFTRINTSRPLEILQADVNRRFVPLNMLTHFETEVFQFHGEEHIVSKEGKTVTISGKPVVVN